MAGEIGIDLTVNGTTYNLNQISGPYLRLTERGMGLPPVNWHVEKGPQQDGETVVGYRLGPRQIALVILVESSDEIDYYTQLDPLMRALRPSTTLMQLRYTRLDGKVRQFDVYCEGALDLASDDQHGQVRKLTVGLKAPDPTCYDPTMIVDSFGIAAGGGSFVVPMPVAFGVGASAVSQVTAITYAGDWKTYPIITIVGPLTNPVVTNLTTDEVLDFTGTTVTAGNTLVIDLRYGRKTVVDQAGTNQIALLTNSSNLDSWSLQADPSVPGGINSVQVTGTSANAVTQVQLVYVARYLYA